MDRDYLLKGSITKAILKLSIPIVFTNVLQSAYQLTDTFWVGRLGPNEVAAVSLSFPVLFLLISLGLGFSIAGTVLVAQYAGQRADHRVNLVCGQTFLVMSTFSIGMSVIGYFLSPIVIHLMGDHPEVNGMAVDYLQISFIGMFFTYAYIMFQSMFRGVGNVKAPFLIVLFSVLLNFVLDPLFIMGWKEFPALGVNGAAYATVFTQGLAAVLGIFLLVQGRYGIQLQFKHLMPYFTEIKQIIKLGIPASAEQSTRALSMLLMMFVVSSFGVVGTAAYGVVLRVLSFVIIPALGFSMATSTVVGQNIGAGQLERAKSSAFIACGMIFLALTFVGIILFFTANNLMAVFVPNAPLVEEEGAHFIKIISLTFGLVGIQQVVNGALRGGGSTLLAMILAMTVLWVFRFPLAYVLSHHTVLKIHGVWWAFCISNILASFISLIVLMRSQWLKKVTSDFDPLERKTIEETMVGDNLPD